MPQSKEDKKEQTRLRVERYRNKQKSVTGTNNVTQDVTQEMVPVSFIEGTKIEFLPERPRYLTLSDGKVLDRANQPEANKELPGMKAANSAYGNVIRQTPGILDALVDPIKRKKLEKTHQSLKAHNVLKEVRFGVSGPTFDVVGELLEATR